MTASFAHRIGILVVTAALLACGASSPPPPPLYAEYSLEASEHPESIECFYGCLRVKRDASREACFARCDGVEVQTTRSPCSEDTPALCRSYAIEETESGGDSGGDQGGKVVGEILGLAIRSGVEAATSDDDDDDHGDHRAEGSHARSESQPRRSASPSPSKKWTSSSPRVAAPPSSFGAKAKKR